MPLTGRDLEIWRLHCSGVKQSAIARRLQVSQPTIHRAVKRVRKTLTGNEFDAQVKPLHWPVNNLNKFVGHEQGETIMTPPNLGASQAD